LETLPFSLCTRYVEPVLRQQTECDFVKQIYFYNFSQNQNITMKDYISLPKIFFASIIFLAACSKDSTKPANPTPPPSNTTSGTMTINLSYTGTTISGNFELIISEPGGKILLDSVAHTQTPIIATLKTNAKLVNLTYILPQDTSTSSPLYFVSVYKDVNPSNWFTLSPGLTGKVIYPKLTSTADKFIFENYPSYAITDGNVFNSFTFCSGINNNISSGAYDAGVALTLGYQRHIGANNYFVIPHLGLYKLFMPGGNNGDTLSLSDMDTASTFTFQRQSPFSIDYAGCTFNGIPDTTDLSKSVSFIDYITPIAPPNVDLQFPKTPMQKYELGIFAENDSKDYLYYYGYVNSLPAQLPFADPSWFSVTSQQNNNLSVTFASPAATSYCNSSFTTTGDQVQVTFWTSPDSTNLQAITFLTDQKSKLLKAFSLSDLTLRSFSFTNVPGYTYSDYFSSCCTAATGATHNINSYTSYTRIF
jgi:hypothetical protein